MKRLSIGAFGVAALAGAALAASVFLPWWFDSFTDVCSGLGSPPNPACIRAHPAGVYDVTNYSASQPMTFAIAIGCGIIVIASAILAWRHLSRRWAAGVTLPAILALLLSRTDQPFASALFSNADGYGAGTGQVVFQFATLVAAAAGVVLAIALSRKERTTAVSTFP